MNSLLYKYLTFVILFLILPITNGEFSVAAKSKNNVEVGDNGLHVQDWLLESFLDLKDDHQTAKENGKFFAIIFEQRGCPYCGALHKNTLSKKEIRSYITKNFDVLQLDLWGSRKVTDFDGKELEERALARRWGVVFTPSVLFFPKDKLLKAGQTGKDFEILRMPGYFKPFHFMSMLQYIKEGQYKSIGFQKYLQSKFKEMEKQGKKLEVW